MTTGQSRLNQMMRWTAAAFIAVLFTPWAVPPAAEAAIAPLLLKSPQEIEFNTYNGVTQMYIADTGNNRVLRADPDGLVNLIINVNNPTAIDVDENGNIYVAESGPTAGLYAYDRDGETLELWNTQNERVNFPINLMTFFQPVPEYPDNLNIKSLIISRDNNDDRNRFAYFHCEAYVKETTYFPPATTYKLKTKKCKQYLKFGGSGSAGPYPTGEFGFARHSDGKVWESAGSMVSLEDVFNISTGDITQAPYGEIAVDTIDKMFYVVVDKTKIERASYEGASFTNRPTLQPWLSLTDKYGISEPHSIAVGPNRALYVTDAANDRIIVVGLDAGATFNRELSLTQEIIDENNEPPLTGSFAKRVKQNQTLTFARNDFLSHYSDPEGDAMQVIRIASLPSHGSLKLGGIPVTQGQVIQEGNLDGLTYTPQSGWGGTTTFEWQAKDGNRYSQATGKVEIAVRVLGDANGDGAATPADALLITKYVKGTITLTADQLEMLDMNGDGVVDAADATIIMNIYSGKAI